MKPRPLPYLGVVAAVAAVYFGAARLGLRLGVVEQVTAVWPPTGIALAALLLGGCRLWPGVLLGAFLANVHAHEPLVTASGIAAGNTLEALAGAWLLRRLTGFHPALGRLRDSLALLLLAAVFSPIISATVGVTSLCLGGVQPWSKCGVLWWVWWVGDALGDLVVAPLLLTWASGPCSWGRWKVAEGAALLVALVAISLTVLAGGFGPALSHRPLVYTVFPFVIWAALRFGPPGTALVTFLASGIAIGGTLHGLGPFAVGTVGERLILLQLFTGVVACTGLILAAAISERNTVARHQAAAYAVTQILAQSATLGEAGSGLLAAVGRGFGWDLGALWEVDRHGTVLRCVEVWQDSSVLAAGFAALTRGQTLSAGVGLPGRIWAGGQPLWADDISEGTALLRTEASAREGLRTACAVPILLEGKPLGVIQFFSRARRQPDPNFLQLMVVLGGQVGLFLERRQADDALRESHGILQAVTEGTTDTVFVKDIRGRYLMINTAGARSLGKSVEEVLNRDDTALFTAETARAIIERDRQVMASGETQTHEEVVTTAGLTRTYLSTKGPYRDPQGNLIGLIGISRDITERKQAEEALRETHEFLTRLLANIPAPVYVTSRAGRIRLVNGAWETLFGLRPEEVVGRAIEQVVPPELARLCSDSRRQIVATAAPLIWEAVLDLPSGRRFYHTIRFPLLDAAGQVEAVGGVSLDITERRQAEDAMRDYADRLQALSRRLVEVQECERRHLARELHDEIGQILTSLKFALEAASSALPETARASRGEARALIDEALTRVRELSFDLRPALLDHLGLLPALRWLIERYTAGTGIGVNFKHAGLEGRLAPELETAAYRIVQEALTNVARHAQVREAAVRIWLDADTLQVQVEDQGTGFDPEAMRAADRSNGLPGIQERALLLGGRLVIESAPGSGTHLLGELPLTGPRGRKIDEHFHRPGR